MKKLAALTIFLAAALAAVPALGGASSGRRLELTAKVTSQRVIVDAAPKGYSAGDVGMISGDVFDRGKLSGRYTGTCTQFTRGNQQCTFVLGLPGGELVVVAGYGPRMNTGSVAREAIVGGTGIYEGARGQGIDRELNNAGTRLRFDLQLMP